MMTVICRFMVFDQQAAGKSGKNSTGRRAVLEFSQANGENTRRMTICKPQDIPLNEGDKVRCLEGGAMVLINPTTRAGAFILTPTVPTGAPWNQRTELEINEETTKIVSRGKIEFVKDIGGIRGGAATTR